MDLQLRRTAYKDAGIFGELVNIDGHILLQTLEHSYNDKPKVPQGEYKCVRGQHKLAHQDHSFETFEVTGVPDHTGILFHVGNFDNDSSGCILLGLSAGGTQLFSSREAFQKFMALQQGVDSFTLIVTD